MDPSEALFKRGVRLWRRFRRSPPRPGPHAAYLDKEKANLQMLASMLFQESISIVAGDEVGGVVGQTMLLPRDFDLFESAELNREAYIYRIAGAYACRNLGFDTTTGSADPLRETLCVVLSVGSMEDKMHADLPSTQPMTDRLNAASLTKRVALKADEISPLEALIRLRLGHIHEYSGPVGDWLNDAASVRAEGAKALRAETDRLLVNLVALAGRPPVPPGVGIWGALLSPAADAMPQSDDDFEPHDDDQGGDRNIIQLDKAIRLQREKLGAREDKPLFHVFEKLETSEEYSGQSATPDASGSPQQMEDALRELNLATVVRTSEAPRNLVRAEVMVDPTALEVAEEPPPSTRAVRYPEWDYKKKEYRQNWCTVVEQEYRAGEAAEENIHQVQEILRKSRRQVDEIRANLQRVLYKRQQQRRQSDGPAIDLEALVERHADLAAGSTPPENLYLAGRKRPREVAILVLLDTSWSTDAWLNGRRVLDIELSALFVVAEAFAGYLDDEIAVANFRSHTRHDVRVGVLKGFDDSWHHLRAVGPSIQPDGYTRIGAAVRHATSMLDQAKARKKLLVIMSDGKPTDYDRYEGRYGKEDVRQAIREARQRNVKTFGLAIEKEAKLDLARMLGPGGYRILPRASLLPEVMAEVFASLVAE